MKSLFGNRKSVVTILGILIFVLGINVTGYALPVSQRTPQVRDAIVAAVPGVNAANDVTEAHLAAITELDLSSKVITSLNSDDFDGLTALTTLNLGSNDLTALPSNIFDNLIELRHLYIDHNDLTSIPAGIFDNNTELTHFSLHDNGITSLPAGIFKNLTKLLIVSLRENKINDVSELESLTSLTTLYVGHNPISDYGPLHRLKAAIEAMAGHPGLILDIAILLVERTQQVQDAIVSAVPGVNNANAVTAAHIAAITELDLSSKSITSLRPNDFDGLTALTTLNLGNNDLTALSAGIFDNLTELTHLYLDHNDLTSIPAGIFDNLTELTHFSLHDNGITSLPAGIFKNLTKLLIVSLRENKINDVSELESLTSLTTLYVGHNPISDYGPLHRLKTAIEAIEDHPGLTLDITLPPKTTNTAPVFTDGTSTTRAIAENTAPGKHIGTAIAATDADNDTLTYTLGGTDASSFSIVSTSGQLQTKAALDYETKTSYVVTVSVSDSNGGSGSIDVTINITDANDAPVFSDGDSTTVTIVLPPKGNTEGDYDVGNPLFATDADGDSVNYSLSGTDAALLHTYLFGRTINGQIQNYVQLTTRGWSLHDANKSSFTVIVTASDRNGGTDNITVTINVTDVNENNAPVFTDGTNTTRSIAENTTSGQHIGTAIAATDADNDPLTYTLGGTDAAAFEIDTTTGQLKTNAALDYETKNTYTVTVTVSDGSSTHTITVTINITDINELPTSTAVCKVGDVLAPGQSCTYPGTDAVFSVLGDGTAQWHIPNLPTWLEWINQTAISGSLRVSTTVNGQAYHFVAEQVGTSWEIKEIGDDRSDPQPETPEQTEEPPPGGGTPTLAVSTAAPLNEATLHEGIVTLTLTGGTYEGSTWKLRDAVSVAGITGIALDRFDTERIGDTKMTVKLEFDGNINTDSTLTLTLGAAAIADYNGAALTAQIPVTAVSESITASTAAPLTAATLDESVVTLTLSGRKFERWNSAIRPAVSVSGIVGVTVGNFDIDRESDTEVTVELTYDGNMTADGTLTFTVGADAIAGYNGPALMAQVPVAAGTETPVEPETPEVPEPPIATNKPIESDYDHIEGPWLWMIAPGGDIDTDNLSEASDGVITEPQIAQNGVNEGDHFDALQWTSGRLRPTTVCGIFLCSSNNVINVVRQIGLTDSHQLSQYSAYALINISSPRDQNDVLMGVGSDDSIKVWLNGSVVYENDVTRRTTGIQNHFPVHLNAGNNLLLIKVCNHGTLITNNDWGMFFKIYLDTQDYTVSLPMGDGNSWQPVTVVDDPTNTAPVFTDGTSTTRTIAENTAAGQHIGTAIAATDTDNDTLTYSLAGTDASAFSIDGTTGQLKTRAVLDYETKNAYTVTITVSDGSLTDTITVTINVTDINEKGGDDTNPQPDTPEQPGNTGGTPTLSVSTAAPLTEATLHGGIITLTLSGGTYESSSWRIREAVTVSGISGVTVETFDVDRVNDTEITVELTYDGNMSANGTLTFTVGAGAIKDYNGAALTRQISVPAVTESVTASTAAPLTEATLDESIITLTLSGRKFERWNSAIRPAVSVSGISGVTVGSFDIDRESDTEVSVELTYDGNMTTDGTLTITVGADAIAGYNGPAFTVQVAVSVSEAPADTGGQNPDPPEQPQNRDTPEPPINTAGTPTLTVSTSPSPLTEATLHGSVVTLTLSGGTYELSRWDIEDAVSVSGISGVTFDGFFDLERVSDTKVTIELEFSGNITTNGTLTFTVGSDGIQGYNGAALTVQIQVTANTESVAASTPSPLKEATLDGSVVTLTLSGAKYSSSTWDIRDGVSVSGIQGVTKPWNQPERKSDTELTIELEFDGTDFDSTATLTFTVEGDAIAGYNGSALTTEITVIAMTESVVASSASPLREATLDGSVVTLTISGAEYTGFIWDIRDAVSVSGISGVTMPWNQPERKSDTQITIELEFDGDMTTDGTLTFTVGADAIAGYNGTALTAQITVTADRENVLLANFPNPFNPETWIPYQLAKPAEVTITIYASNGQLVRTLALGHQPDGFYYSRSRAAYWDGRNAFGEPVASGVYFYTITAGDFTATRKMLIRK